MKRNLMLLAAGVLATGLIAAGCGDGNDDESSDTGTDAATAPTKAEFVAEANEVCKQGNAELEAAGEETFKGKPTQADLEAFVTDTLVPNVQGQIDDIRALGIPEGDEAVVNGFLDDAEGVLDDLEADPSLLDKGDPFAAVNKELAAYGLTTCAGG